MDAPFVSQNEGEKRGDSSPHWDIFCPSLMMAPLTEEKIGLRFSSFRTTLIILRLVIELIVALKRVFWLF